MFAVIVIKDVRNFSHLAIMDRFHGLLLFNAADLWSELGAKLNTYAQHTEGNADIGARFACIRVGDQYPEEFSLDF